MREEDAMSFSPLEIGLLTVADRRGAVRTRRRIDTRNDATEVERLAVLRELSQRGLLQEADEQDPETIEFTLTDAGREALQGVDATSPPLLKPPW
jgi:hypothetical protein